MTKVTATVAGNHYRIEADGHAEDSRVCAGISALMCALEGAVKNSGEAAVVYSTMNPGHMMVEFLAKGTRAAEDAVCILIGLMQIELAHPDQIEVYQNFFE